MKRFIRPLAVVLAVLGVLIVGMAVQIARGRAHQLPLGNQTLKAH